MKICVFLSRDYKKSEYFDVDDSLKRDEIMLEIYKRFGGDWYYCDFLTKEQEEQVNNKNK